MDSGGWAGKWPVNASSLLPPNLWRIRGGKGIRTPGLLIANETLYQLSYTPALPMKAEPRQVATISLCTPIYYTGGSERMRTLQSKIGVFEKVGECLYRYSRNGVYYARIKADGKEIKRSLETTDRALHSESSGCFGMSSGRLIARKES